jgi:hypothetical protein
MGALTAAGSLASALSYDLNLASFIGACLVVLSLLVFGVQIIRRDRQQAREDLERAKARVAADEHWASVRDTVCTDQAGDQIEQLCREIRDVRDAKDSTEEK